MINDNPEEMLYKKKEKRDASNPFWIMNMTIPTRAPTRAPGPSSLNYPVPSSGESTSRLLLPSLPSNPLSAVPFSLGGGAEGADAATN